MNNNEMDNKNRITYASEIEDFTVNNNGDSHPGTDFVEMLIIIINTLRN